MSIITTDSKHYNDIARAIREKTGSTDTYKPEEMAGAIRGIEGGGGGGASSWSDLAEKTAKVGGDTLTWDGNKDGLVNVMGMIYKISDNVLTADDVQNGAIVTTSDGAQTSCSGSEIREWIEAYGVVAFLGVYSIPSDNFEASGIVFPEAGIYVMADDAAPAHVKSITVNGYTGFVSEQTVVTPIPTEYLPEHLQFGKESVWETVVDRTAPFASAHGTNFYMTNRNGTFTVEADTKYRLEIDGVSFGSAMSHADTKNLTAQDYYIGNLYFYGQFSNASMTKEEVEAAGYVDTGEDWFATTQALLVTKEVSGNLAFVMEKEGFTPKPMDEKYMPILTSPGGKKFKISVDDSGVISAVEV
jgi:hypothetical protein